MKTPRTRYVRVIFGLAALGLMLLAAGFLSRIWEPRYEGRGLSDWIVEFRGTPESASSVPDKHVTEAFRAMGPKAQRRLLWSARRDSSPWERHWNRVRGALGPVGVRLPMAFDQDTQYWRQYRNRLSNLLADLLPESLPVILQGVHSTRSEVREVAMSALSSIREPDTQTRDALSGGIEASDPWVQMAAIGAIRKMKSAGSFATPALVSALRRKNPTLTTGSETMTHYVQQTALIVLGDLGGQAQAALPEIKVIGLNLPDAYGRVAAARALWKIETNPSLSFPVLRAEFDAFDPNMKWMILECFREMGTNAATAIPQVKAFAAAPDTEEYQKSIALEALKAMQSNPASPNP